MLTLTKVSPRKFSRKTKVQVGISLLTLLCVAFLGIVYNLVTRAYAAH